MESRGNFEVRLNQIVSHRIHRSKNPREEALWLLDVFCAACFFCARVMDHSRGPDATMDLIVNRLAGIKKMILEARNSGGNGSSSTGETDVPRIIRP